MQSKHARAGASIPPQNLLSSKGDEEPPQDIDAFRGELLQRLRRIVGNRGKRWRTCGEPSCKRTRRCCTPRGLCSNGRESQRPIKPEHRARNLAWIQRSIRERLEQLDAERERANSAAQSHKKS